MLWTLLSCIYALCWFWEQQETAVAASQKVKQGVSLLLDGIKTALIIPPEEMEEDEAETITFSSAEHIFDRAKVSSIIISVVHM